MAYKKLPRGQDKALNSDCKSTASDSASQKVIAKANTNVMRTSGFHADPLAAIMQMRTIGMAKLNAN